MDKAIFFIEDHFEHEGKKYLRCISLAEPLEPCDDLTPEFSVGGYPVRDFTYTSRPSETPEIPPEIDRPLPTMTEVPWKNRYLVARAQCVRYLSVDLKCPFLRGEFILERRAAVAVTQLLDMKLEVKSMSDLPDVKSYYRELVEPDGPPAAGAHRPDSGNELPYPIGLRFPCDVKFNDGEEVGGVYMFQALPINQSVSLSVSYPGSVSGVSGIASLQRKDLACGEGSSHAVTRIASFVPDV
ncbi:MAG: hypothetical protein AAF532_12300 [Planctomycetota bacterium]